MPPGVGMAMPTVVAAFRNIDESHGRGRWAATSTNQNCDVRQNQMHAVAASTVRNAAGRSVMRSVAANASKNRIHGSRNRCGRNPPSHVCRRRTPFWKNRKARRITATPASIAPAVYAPARTTGWLNSLQRYAQKKRKMPRMLSKSSTRSVRTVPNASEKRMRVRRQSSAGRATSPARIGRTVDSM